MRTVVAVYDQMSDARAAIDDLVAAGFPREDISLVASDSEGKYSTEIDETAEGAAEGAVAGGLLGGVAGAVVGLLALAIPGVGPIIAAGPIAAALTGAGIGAVSGGLLGALAGAGLSDEDSEYYAEAVRRGGVLVTVQADEYAVEEAQGILNRHHAVDMESRAQSWDEGWDQNWMRSDDEGYDRNWMRSEDEGYTAYGDLFRQHYHAEYRAGGYPYSRYEPAYRYGYTLATDKRYSDYEDWNELREVARRDWDENQGVWDDIENAVHYAWYRVVEAARGVGDTVEDFFDPDDDFESYGPVFRKHYDTHYATRNGYSYSLYEPAYHYGYALGTYDRYDDYDSWDELEYDARREWEENFDEPWEDVKDAVREGWRTVAETAEDVWEEVTDPLDGDDDH